MAEQLHDSDAPKLTRSQLSVLRDLNNGCVMRPHGRDELGGLILGNNGYERVVAPKTVSFLFSECLIQTGDVYAPWILTPKGREIAQHG